MKQRIIEWKLARRFGSAILTRNGGGWLGDFGDRFKLFVKLNKNQKEIQIYIVPIAFVAETDNRNHKPPLEVETDAIGEDLLEELRKAGAF